MMRLLLLFISIFFVFASLGHAEFNDNEANEDMGKETDFLKPILPNVDLGSSVKYQVLGNEKITVRSTYPELFGDDDVGDNLYFNLDDFNQRVSHILQQEIDQFAQKVRENKANELKRGRSRLYLDYDTAIIKPKKNIILSIRFSIQGYIAGSNHPFHYYRVLNYDLINGRSLSLDGLFQANSDWLQTIAQLATRALNKKLPKQSIAEEGIAPRLENYKNWSLHPKGLFITFNGYQFAPNDTASKTIVIPYRSLESLLAPDAPIATCIKYPKRCRRDNLVTGGFMEGAINPLHRILNKSLYLR